MSVSSAPTKRPIAGTAAASLSIGYGRVSKAEAAIDEWLKDLAPSTDLRKWFGHDPDRWAEFRRRYTEEIHGHAELLAHLRELVREGPVTLVYSAHDEVHNDAIVLRDLLLGRSALQENDHAR